VIVDGNMIYSKFNTGQFPEHEEIIEKTEGIKRIMDVLGIPHS